MKQKIAARNCYFPKILFIFCLLPLSTLIYAITWLKYTRSLEYYFSSHLFWDFSIYFSLFSFILVKSKRKVAFVLAIIATVFSFAYTFCDLSKWKFASFQVALPNIPKLIYPLILCVLLTIYCASPRTNLCYLFAEITGSLLVIVFALSIFTGTAVGHSTVATMYMLGFLTNTDMVVESVVPQKKKIDISSTLDKLEKFAQLKEQGILTAEEFEAKKQELMNQM